MGRQRIWGSLGLALLLLQVCAGGQQQPHKATVHIVVKDGFGRDLGEAEIASFRSLDTGQDLAGSFRENTTGKVPYGVYQARVHKVGWITGQVTAQVFKPDVWVVVSLRIGEELPVFPAPRLQMSGTINNLDPTEEPVYVRLAGVYSDFMMDTRVEPVGNSGRPSTFSLAGVIPDGEYILIVIGRTGILDVRPLHVEFPARAPIVVDLGGLQMSGIVKSLDPEEEPVYLRLVGVHSHLTRETTVQTAGHSGTFTFSAVIPEGQYVLMTIGRTRILDVRQLDVEFPARTPVVIDLGQRGNGAVQQH